MRPDDDLGNLLTGCERAYGAGDDPGNVFALVDALHLCRIGGLCPPAWVYEASIKHLMTSLKALRGRLLQDRIDFERFHVVEGLGRDRAELKEAGRLDLWLSRGKRSYSVVGGSRFERAARVLHGTIAAGEPEAIKKSWERVPARLDVNPFRYRVPLFVFLTEERADPDFELRMARVNQIARLGKAGP